MRGQVSVVENSKLASEKPATLIAGMVDEDTWNAASVGELTLAGEITGAHFVDVDTDTDYTQRVFPVEIPHGHSIYCDVLGQHTGGVEQWMRCTVELYDPDGILRASNSADATISPGTFISSGITQRVKLDKPGTWVIYGKLEAELA